MNIICKTLTISIAVGLTFFGQNVNATLLQYNDRSSFEATLSTIITDDYSATAYSVGDNFDTLSTDSHSNSQMNSIFGETDYFTTGFSNLNLIIKQPANPSYCAGCNGSFRLGFTTTSIGNASGVFGVGFDILGNSSSLPYDAFVTFGDSSTINFDLGIGPGFFGLTSDIGITSIHLGLANGIATTEGSFEIDNLTIGVPEPTTIALLGLGLAGIGYRRHHNSKKAA